jgi:hypothetical protein
MKIKDILTELTFMGSECTKDCSGHKAGYNWSRKRGGKLANSWSPSFNKGAALALRTPTERQKRKVNQILKASKKRVTPKPRS